MERIILDVDPGIDDSLAIILALKCDAIQVEGLTIVSGNIEVNQGAVNALKAVSMAGRPEIRVYKGMALPLAKPYVDATDTHGRDGIGENFFADTGLRPEAEHAVDFLLRTVEENPGVITLAALGPLTNVAAAIQRAPATMKKLRKIILMGGAARFHGNCSPVAEYNFWVDPDAAKIVFASGIDITMVGLDVTHSILFSPNLREVVNQFGTDLSKYIVDITRFYVDFHWEQERTIGCVINDPLVVAALVNPDLMETEDAYVSIETAGIGIGQSLADFGGVWTQGLCNAHVATRVNPRGFFDLFLKKLFPEFSDDIDLLLSKQYWGESEMV